MKDWNEVHAEIDKIEKIFNEDENFLIEKDSEIQSDKRWTDIFRLTIFASKKQCREAIKDFWEEYNKAKEDTK